LPSDDENAAVDLVAAGELIEENSKPWRRFGRISPALPLDDKEMLVIGNVLDASRDALRKLDSAMAKPQVHWGQTYQSPMLLSDRQRWYGTRPLVSLLRAAALRSHQMGNERDALARIGQILFIARAIDRDPSLWAHCTANSARSDACDAIVQIAPDLVADSASTTADMRALIADLTDEAGHRRALVRALQGERMRTGDFVRAYAAGHSELISREHAANLDTRMTRIMWLPFMLNDGPIALDHVSRVIDAARSASHWPGMRASVPNLDWPMEVIESPSFHCLTCMILSHLERPLQAHFHSITEQRLTAMTLAIRLYASDHDGQYPADLDALVPSYLPALPIDPMAAGGRLLRVIPANDGAILYSVGDNGTDDGGDDWSVHVKSYPFRCSIDWSTPDFVVHLVRQARVRTDDED
jgi:hypothetical protein